MSDDESTRLRNGSGAIRRRVKRLRASLTQPRENHVKQWFLLTGSRVMVTGVLLALVFLTLLGLATIRPLQLRTLLTETNAVKTLFSTLLSGAILLVSIVVSINSVVLTQEITDIETQQERVSASIEFRRHIEETIEPDVTPARPAEFLTTVMYAISEQTETLLRQSKQKTNESYQDRMEGFAEQVEAEISHARATLGRTRLGTFGVLLAGLNYDYSGQLHALRTLQRRFNSELTEDDHDAFGSLVETMKHMATGREYFKSLYYKRELARLSSILLYVSLPVIVFTSYVILALDAGLFPDVRMFGISPLLVSVLFAYTVALSPYLVLTAFVVRATTITLRTLAAGPFILQESRHIDSFDWERPTTSRDWSLTDGDTDD